MYKSTNHRRHPPPAVADHRSPPTGGGGRQRREVRESERVGTGTTAAARCSVPIPELMHDTRRHDTAWRCKASHRTSPPVQSSMTIQSFSRESKTSTSPGRRDSRHCVEGKRSVRAPPRHHCRRSQDSIRSRTSTSPTIDGWRSFRSTATSPEARENATEGGRSTATGETGRTHCKRGGQARGLAGYSDPEVRRARLRRTARER